MYPLRMLVCKQHQAAVFLHELPTSTKPDTETIREAIRKSRKRERSSMKKLKLTQWQYNKMQRLINILMDKYYDVFIKDVEDFCKQEGFDMGAYHGRH